jgi:hypothetical protein
MQTAAAMHVAMDEAKGFFEVQARMRQRLDENRLQQEALRQEAAELEEELAELEQWGPMHSLFEACASGDVEGLRTLLFDDARAWRAMCDAELRKRTSDFCGGEGTGLLSECVRAGSVGSRDCAHLLLEAGYSVHWDETALLWACAEDDFDLVGMLLAHGADPTACQARAFAVVRYDSDVFHLLADAVQVDEGMGDEHGAPPATPRATGDMTRAWQELQEARKRRDAARRNLRRCWLALRGLARATRAMRRLQARAAERAYRPGGLGYRKVATQTLVGKTGRGKPSDESAGARRRAR